MARAFFITSVIITYQCIGFVRITKYSIFLLEINQSHNQLTFNNINHSCYLLIFIKELLKKMEGIKNGAYFTNNLSGFGRYFYQVSIFLDSFLTIICQSVNMPCISCCFDRVFWVKFFVREWAQKSHLSFDKRLSISFVIDFPY